MTSRRALAICLIITVFACCEASDENASTIKEFSLNTVVRYIAARLANRTGNYTVNPKVISPECYEDILYLNDINGKKYKSYSSTPDWQRHILDAGGKLPAGLSEGNAFWMGDYTQCTRVEVWKNTAEPVDRPPDFKGKYCTHNLNHYMSSLMMSMKDVVFATNGVCVPSSCTSKDVEHIINEYVFPLRTRVTADLCYTNDKSSPDGFTILALIPFAILGTLVVLGTVLETFPLMYNKLKRRDCDNHSDAEPIGNVKLILQTFSAYNNTIKLFATQSTDRPLECINGIRAISMILIVAGHVMLLVLILGIGGHNPVILMTTIMPNWWAQPFMYIQLTVDTFLCLTAFLVTVIIMEIGIPSGRFHTLAFYVHRIFRITPTYLLLAIFTCGPYQMLGSGPVWNSSPFMNLTTCRATLWSAPLHINSYADQRTTLLCLPHLWYLDSEIVLYFLSPIILYPIVKKHWSAHVLWVIAYIAACITVRTIAHVTKSENLFNYDVLITHISKYLRHLHMKPWGRISSFLIGILFGYIHYHYGKNLKMSKTFVCAAWIVTTSAMLACIYGYFPYEAKFMTTGPSRFAQEMYIIFVPSTWSFGVGWIIFACSTGYGGYVNNILSWRLFTPIGRLSFCTFMVHFLVIWHFNISRKHTIYTDAYLLLYTSFGGAAMSLFFGYILCLLVEAPTIQLTELMVRRNSKRKTTTETFGKEIEYNAIPTDKILVQH